ncbi:MAG TPA: glycosyltransferase [Acidimicrobiales bacterium]|nr:glycosyltransferase [Acidimicrobiales bacterium]
MYGLQRFDVETTPAISDAEIKRRWNWFHHEIRNMSGMWWQRWAGQLLGENTLRYRVVRWFFRPLLKALRAGREKPSPTKVAASKAVEVFPVNYRPRVIAPLDQELLESALREIEVIVVDESVGEATALINELNERVGGSTKTWLLLVDTTSLEQERQEAAALLWRAARDEDDVVFGDEAGPLPFSPILKSPAVGPHTLLSYNLVGRPALLRRSVVRDVGGFDEEAGWAFEHDLYLLLRETNATFHHVPHVFRAGRSPLAFDPVHVDTDTIACVERALARRGIAASTAPGGLAGLVKWRPVAPLSLPSIDIIIPTRDRVDLVKQCLASIEERTTYPNYDVIILDNDSVKAETLEFFRTTKYRVVPCPGPFNYAHIVNRGVAHSGADYVVTLNNDTIVSTPDWLEQLLGLCALSDVGIVGACLLDRDERREHESIVIAPYPQHLRTDSNYPHRDHFSLAIKDVAAVTGAVQMVERTFWEHLGGMDEQLKVVMNDVDLCLRSLIEGRHVLYTPEVRLFHHVGSSRGDLDPLDDRDRFLRRWDIFASFVDPFFPEAVLLLGEKMFYFLREQSIS